MGLTVNGRACKVALSRECVLSGELPLQQGQGTTVSWPLTLAAESGPQLQSSLCSAKVSAKTGWEKTPAGLAAPRAPPPWSHPGHLHMPWGMCLPLGVAWAPEETRETVMHRRWPASSSGTQEPALGTALGTGWPHSGSAT